MEATSTRARRLPPPRGLAALAALSRRGLVALLGAASALGLAACEELGGSTQATPHAKAPLRVSATYARYCALCHGDAGEGGAADHAPALTNSAYLSLASDEFLLQSIRRGHPGTPMSAFSTEAGGPLSEEDIRGIITFLRAFQEGGTVDVGLPSDNAPVDPQRVARATPVFRARCASCHGEQGEGRTAPTLNNRVFHELATDEFLRRTIADGRPGTEMQGFANSLTPEQIDDLVHHVRSLGAPSTASVTAHGGDAERWAELEGDQLVLNPEGRAPDFAPANAYVSADQVKRALDQGRRLLLFDARAVSDWRAGHLPGALPAPFYADDAALRRVPNDGTQIVVYCGCPHVAADRLAARLREAGYERVAVIDEGFYHWRDQGYPLDNEPNSPTPVEP